MGVAQIADLIEQTGLIGMLALALGAIVFLTKKVFSQHGTIEEGLKAQNQQLQDQNEKLIALLKDSTAATVNYTNAQREQAQKFEDLVRLVDGQGPRLQSIEEQIRRMLREAKLSPD